MFPPVIGVLTGIVPSQITPLTQGHGRTREPRVARPVVTSAAKRVYVTETRRPYRLIFITVFAAHTALSWADTGI